MPFTLLNHFRLLSFGRNDEAENLLGDKIQLYLIQTTLQPTPSPLLNLGRRNPPSTQHKRKSYQPSQSHDLFLSAPQNNPPQFSSPSQKPSAAGEKVAQPMQGCAPNNFLTTTQTCPQRKAELWEQRENPTGRARIRIQSRQRENHL
ncbi:hypothetical protein J3F83DRAFT_40999 [Trichoderma novae-zelandiae]